MGLPGQKHHTHIAVFLLLGEEVNCVTLTGGREHEEASTQILPDSTCVFSLMIWVYILNMSLLQILAMATTAWCIL